MDIFLWVLALLMILVGAAGTVLPALPGPPLILLGALLAAWIDRFTVISGLTCAILSALALLAMVVDFVSGSIGAQRVGASRQAIIGSVIGTLLGVFTGLWGLIFMPLVGAAAGEFLARRQILRAGQVGLATWLGLLMGTVIKLALVMTMLGIFIASLLID
ncbi:MAG: hypothetical protein RL322_2789 [Pseudomonadota bacterium]|jgi:uncharacterized protein YqgC (DUF456 family)